MGTGKSLKEAFNAVKKRVKKLQGQMVTVSYRSGQSEIQICGIVEEVYDHIFTIRGRFKEAFSYADVFSEQVRLVEGQHDNL